jgi:uncharacterized protein YgiM (DUF1202 family)
MRRSRWLFSLLLALLCAALIAPAFAQGIEPDPANPLDPNANINWPPPVYVVRGVLEVRGSANLPNMTNYFIEYRPVGADLVNLSDEDAPWQPATLPSTSAISNDVLGRWDTTLTDDGIYELRLTINVRGGQPVFFRLAPIRVENTPPPFAVVPTATQVPAALPTLLPTPTALDATPRVTARLNANVRLGDNTFYGTVGALLNGTTAPIIGISTTGSGWFLIQLDDGRRGWVSPTVVDVSGDLRQVPSVEPPPPPPPTATPIPPTPVSAINLVAGNFRFDPSSPVCSQTFNIYIDVANFGTATSPGGFIGIQDVRRLDGSPQGSTVGSFGPIAPGQTVNIGPIPITISTWYNEEHTLTMTVDGANQIAETNEADNVRQAIYVLQRGTCP